ncbi:hypothetical protein [Neolewinella persica]|uniref:hypothetical protein n=1 Tax=Neolewinella persica TaxID=70998 RepID=UPI000364BEF4|nr:hypothetical protein [Neolewinella persica]
MANAKSIFNTLVVIFLLIGLPAVSYYYLSTGYTYRKEAINTQGDFGEMPDLSSLTVVQGKLPKSSRGAMTVVGWFDPTKPAAARQYGEMMDSLYQQFENSPNLYFTTIVNAENPVAAATDFTEKYHLPKAEMLTFLAADAGQFKQSARDFKLPTSLPGEDPIVALVDSSLTIVKHYNLAERNQTIGLVNLISLIIPLPERPGLVLKRDNEL